MPELPGAAPRSPEFVVGTAIQDLAAARLARGFMPLAAVFVIGVGQIFTHGPLHHQTLALLLGAPLAAVTMLAHGLHIVQRAFGRPPRPWMALATLGSLVPPVFGLYVLGWRGLRGVAVDGGPVGVVLGALFALLGIWALGAWMKLNDLQALARAMIGAGKEGDSAV